jgi:hypothetical protein
MNSSLNSLMQNFQYIDIMATLSKLLCYLVRYFYDLADKKSISSFRKNRIEYISFLSTNIYMLITTTKIGAS